MIYKELAEEYATRECCTTCKNINHFCKEKCECWIFAMKGFLAGAYDREKRIAELKAQIEKMKCCENCRHYFDEPNTDKNCNNCDDSLSSWEVEK